MSVYPSVSTFVSLYVHPSIYPFGCLFLCQPDFLSLILSLSHSFSDMQFLWLLSTWLSLTFCITLSLSLPFTVSLGASLPVSMHKSVSLSLSLYVSCSVSLCLFVYVSFFVTVSLYLNPSHLLFVSVSVCLSLSL